MNHLRKAISKKADREAVEADLERVHKALRCKANVHAMSEALSQKLDIHSFLTATTSLPSKIPAFDPSDPKVDLGTTTKDSRMSLSGRPGSPVQPVKRSISTRP